LTAYQFNCAFRYRQKQVDAVLSWGHDAAFIPGILESKNVVFGMIASILFDVDEPANRAETVEELDG